MKDDAQFEARLRQQSVKPIPGEWREDILRRAGREVESHSRAPVSAVSWFEELKSRLVAVLSPSPRAWAGLASVWAAILVLNLSGGYEPATGVMTKPVSVAQTRMALKQKQMLLIELAGWTEAREAIQPQAISPGPRSQRREETRVV